MEDRLTPVLYLEMTGASPDEYAASRVGEVLAQPGVERATWWRNVYRDRPDLPRELPEFDTLGVYECAPSFAAPATPDGVTGHHFLRTPRPGQGRLTGKPTVSLSLVLISPTTEDQAQPLRDWGDFVHLNHIVEAGVPGYTMITPYENATKGDPRYMHFYEFDDPDAEVTFKRMRPLVEERLGPWGSPACEAWAFHPALRIMYVNSFSLVGEKTRQVSEADGGPPFFDVVFAQRACREFSDAPVDDATIELVLRAATHAPSAENKQPWEFVVVRDPDAQKVIHDLTEAAWVAAGRAFSEPRIPASLLKEVDYGIAGGGYRTAPVLVVVCVDLERGMRATVGSSIFTCVQNLLLAANAVGLGSALTTLGAHADELRALLALPEHVEPQAVIPLGAPGRPLGPPRREPATEHTHRDRYGTPW